MDLEKGELHVWHYIVDEREYRTELLSANEKERAARFINQSDAVRYVCNHQFMRKVLSSYLQVPPGELQFDHSNLGKPYIKGSGVFFNLSYRDQYGLLAISKDNEVGVDIEQVRPVKDMFAFASLYFSEKENAIIFHENAGDPIRALFTFWSLKEAFVKATGKGLSIDISQINLSDFFYTETNSLPFNGNALWTIKKIKIQEGFTAAFAIQGKVSKHLEFFYDRD